MTNEEIWNIGLEERTDELSKLQSEYDRFDVEWRKAEFEMDMYARLREVNNAMLYKQKFSEKYEKCARTSESLRNRRMHLRMRLVFWKKRYITLRLFARSTQTEALTMKPHLRILKILTKVIIVFWNVSGKRWELQRTIQKF